MDVLKTKAKSFTNSLVMYTVNLDKFDRELASQLYSITKNSEKLRFLSYLKNIVETKYQDHIKVCKNPQSCSENQSLEIALYSINQQYDYYLEREGGIISSEKPIMKFFAEGQYFDAYTSIKEIVKKAKQEIILIDGYVDDNTLAFFNAKDTPVKLKLITQIKQNKDLLQRGIELYNKQYENLEVLFIENYNYHDRFLMIDDKDFYTGNEY